MHLENFANFWTFEKTLVTVQEPSKEAKWNQHATTSNPDNETTIADINANFTFFQFVMLFAV